MSPSLEICGDVLDRVHYQMAEANTRPVVPASAKAASVVAAVVTTGAKVPKVGVAANLSLAAAVAPIQASDKVVSAVMTATTAATAPATTLPTPLTDKSEEQRNSSFPLAKLTSDKPRLANRQLSGHSSVDSSSGGGGGANSSLASSASSFASSFVSSETIASNLRKMIASSSASISRKLNINTSLTGAAGASNSSSSGSYNSSPGRANAANVVNAAPAPAPATSAAQASRETEAEFEARQATYRHPVIQCDPSSQSMALAAMRPKSSIGNRSSTGTLNVGGESLAQSENKLRALSITCSTGDNLNDEQQSSQALDTGASAEGEPKRATLATSSGQASRSAPPLQYFKIQRPWIACLERNKRMWREQSLLEQHK